MKWKLCYSIQVDDEEIKDQGQIKPQNTPSPASGVICHACIADSRALVMDVSFIVEQKEGSSPENG